ncbi:MAG: hypothetical protein AAFU64_14750, partial [Bacteroidota bacterium]
MRKIAPLLLICGICPFFLKAQKVSLNQGHNYAITTTAITDDGQIGFSGGADKLGIFWDLNTGREIDRILHNSPLKVSTFAHHSRLLAFAGNEKAISFYQVGQQKAPEAATIDMIPQSMAFSPDNRYLFVGGIKIGAGKPLIQFDVEEKKIYRAFPIDRVNLAKLTLSKDGKFLAVAQMQGKISIWDIETQKMLRESEKKFTYEITSLEFSPDNSRLLISGSVGWIWLWDWQGVASFQKIQSNNIEVSYPAARFGESAQEILTAGGKQSQIWKTGLDKNVKRYQLLDSIPINTIITQASFSQDCQKIFYADNSFKCGVLEREALNKQREFPIPAIYPKSLAIHQNLIALEGSNEEIKILDLKQAEFIHSLSEIQPVNTVPLGNYKTSAFSPNGRYLASVQKNRTAIIFDLETVEPFKSKKFEMPDLISS